MPNEPDWLTAANVIALHASIVSATGGPGGVRDIGLLESAIVRPRQLWVYGAVSDVVDLASLMILALARNHPFTQGNKRAGFVAGQAFLEYNGYQLTVPDSVDFADIMIRTIADPALDAGFTALSRRHTVAAP